MPHKVTWDESIGQLSMYRSMLQVAATFSSPIPVSYLQYKADSLNAIISANSYCGTWAGAFSTTLGKRQAAEILDAMKPVGISRPLTLEKVALLEVYTVQIGACNAG